MLPRALVSVHDVMPSTLEDVEASIALLNEHRIQCVALLIVPGVHWSEKDLQRVRALAADGHELVAHGWRHRTTPRGLYHRLHARVLSRNVAEHLALAPSQIIDLMCRSHDWFGRSGLPHPATYIPPAWALGPVSGYDLRQQPFAVIETLRGVRLRLPSGAWDAMPMPLLGFEADTALRGRLLAGWNRVQLIRAQRRRQMPRLSLHPFDHRLRLGHQLRAVLSLGWTSTSYASLVGDGAGNQAVNPSPQRPEYDVTKSSPACNES